ncbi:DNA-directed RNA polymerase I core subunit rpa12 [Globomyces sp. JEL0801]|nr:DNA-directed RNA polymerase I core subunit rpa12 [Globomyces sp. JEL0801]
MPVLATKQHSLVFCPDCGSLLDAPSGADDVVECHCCGTTVPEFESIEIITKSRPESFPNKPTLTEKSTDRHQHLKDGATIQDKCPKCGHHEMVFHTAQLRSADEGQTVFYNCVKCGHKYSINS